MSPPSSTNCRVLYIAGRRILLASSAIRVEFCRYRASGYKKRIDAKFFYIVEGALDISCALDLVRPDLYSKSLGHCLCFFKRATCERASIDIPKHRYHADPWGSLFEQLQLFTPHARTGAV